MALKKSGEHWYGDGREDLVAELTRYSTANGYPATRFADPVCGECGCRTFYVAADDDEGVVVRICTACEVNHYLADSEDYADALDEDPPQLECVCGNEAFEVTVGVALYAKSQDVRWCYIGCRCPKCDLVGCFADYKCEAGDVERFLTAI